MAKRPVCTVLALHAAALAGLVFAAPSPPPEYKLGDVAQADIVTPVALVVMNPDATEVLKQKVAQQVHLVIRHSPHALAEAENELRASIATARQNFMTSIRQADLEAASFARVIGEISGRSPKDFPFERLASFWVRGESGDALVESMLRPVRDFMARPIIANENEIMLPLGQPLRLVRVKNLSDPPSLEVEKAGETLPAGRILVLWRVQRLVENQFAAFDQEIGRFAASLVRANAVLDPDATAAWRARELAGVTVNDAYDAAQVIVRKGQVIDRKALSALAAMREKSLIGTLQVKLEQEQSVAELIRTQTMWIAAGLGAVGLALIAILFRLRTRPRSALVPISIGRPELGSGDARLLGAGADDPWASRALVAGGDTAPEDAGGRASRSSTPPTRPAQPPSGERPDLPSPPLATETEVRTIGEQPDERWRERIAACEKRIAELENDLAVKSEETGETSATKTNGALAEPPPAERERNGASVN